MKVNHLLKALNKGIDKKPAQMWPTVDGGVLDRTKHVTASEIGDCARKIKINKVKMQEKGYKPELGTNYDSSVDWGFFERGHNVEAWFVDLLHAGFDNNHYQLMYTGKDQVSFTDQYQSGTPDGIIMSEDELFILEIKSIDPRTNITRLPKLLHIDQVMQNMDLASDYFGKSPAGGLLIYIDASNYQKINGFQIEADHAHMDRLQARAEYIMETAPEDLKPEGLFKDRGCEYCQHTAECSAMIAAKNNGESYDRSETSKRIFG